MNTGVLCQELARRKLLRLISDGFNDGFDRLLGGLSPHVATNPELGGDLREQALGALLF